MSKRFPDTLIIGAVLLDFAMITYTILIAISVWGSELECGFIRDIFSIDPHLNIVLLNFTILINICASFLGWLGAILITIYTTKRLFDKELDSYDPYEVAPMTPCLAFVTSLLVVMTMFMHGEFKGSPCSIVLLVVVMFLLISGYTLLRFFSVSSADRETRNTLEDQIPTDGMMMMRHWDPLSPLHQEHKIRNQHIHNDVPIQRNDFQFNWEPITSNAKARFSV